MDYLTLFTSHNLALLSNWFDETGELYADIYLPHSGTSSSAYFLHSMKDLKSLVSQQTHPEIVISIFHNLQNPLRGIADEKLLEQALRQIPDGEPYSIVGLDFVYPSTIARWGDGKSHEELQREFAEVLGEKVGIGQDPFDVHPKEWFSLHRDEVFQVSVLRNQGYFEPYAKEPERYRSIIDLWNE